MNIRTISQLPRTDENIGGDGLFEVSQCLGEGKYQSKSIQLSSLRLNFENEISNYVGTRFGLYEGGNQSRPISVTALSGMVHQLSCGTISVYGKKTFANNIPEIRTTLQYDSSPAQVTNVGQVKTLINDRSLFIGPNYMLDADPGTDVVPHRTAYRDEFMYWHIDDFGTDSAQWHNPEYDDQQTELNGVECQHTGYLNIFGWVADNGNIKPSDAWVGLFGQVQVRDSLDGTSAESMQTKWVLLQLHPWVIGSKSSERQYVSFNVPVKKGLRLKIKTGFAVNGNTGGFEGQGNISFSLNQPNAFVGYILRAED